MDNFRTVDISVFEDEETLPITQQIFDASLSSSLPSAESLETAFLERTKKVRSLTSNPQDALIASLADPPLGPHVSLETKKASTVLVVDSLANIRGLEIARTLAAMSPEQIDVLLKYIYKGMEFALNCNVLLAWHEKVVGVSGVGGIMRVLCDRKSI